jgi:uncharacterized membrane protein YjdF
MFTMRVIFLLCLIILGIYGKWQAVLFNSIPFVGSLFVPWMGRRRHVFYLLDMLIMLIFTIALLPEVVGGWPQPTSWQSVFFGFDKLFHIAGGVTLAVFLGFWLRPYVKNRRVFYLLLLLGVLALGSAWELLEWTASLLPAPWTYPSSGYSDTMADLLADLIGGGLVVLVMRIRRFR